MATNTDTQAYLAESKTPTVMTPAQAKTASRAYSDKIGDAARQTALQLKLLQAAEIAEADDGLRQQMEEGFQKLNALARAEANIQREIRAAVSTYREFLEWDARFRAVAGDFGYTV